MEILEWSKEHLEDKLHGSGLDRGLELDFDNIIIAGHSSGAHVEVEFLKHYCDTVKAQILFSPVDGVDPFGFVQDYCITPGERLNFEMPTLVIPAGLDQVPGSSLPLWPACAPEKLSNLRFWNALNGNAWFINATSYGHIDFLEDDYQAVGDVSISIAII